MKRVLFSVLITCFLLTITPVVWGDAFDNPPETNPNITWETQFPYQRNILLDFSVNPVGDVGPIPGADYEGYDDSILWDSDYVEFTGDVTWNEGLGAVGLFDSVGDSSGSLIINIDNWERDWPVKHLYVEFNFHVEQVTGHLYIDWLGLPEGYEEGDYWVNYGGSSGSYWFQYWVPIEPNPPWEQFIIDLDTSDTGSIYLDSIHIATECVPTPTAVILGILGLGAVGIKLRKYA